MHIKASFNFQLFQVMNEWNIYEVWFNCKYRVHGAVVSLPPSENTPLTCCWEKTGQDDQESTKKKKASLQWIRSCWKTGVSVHRKNLLEENSVVTWNQTELFGHNEQQYVLRREGEAFNPENTRPTVQHGAASITLWGCFAASGSAALKKVNGIMKEEDYFQQDCARKKTHLLHRLCQEEWLKIVPEVYQKLVDGYKKRLTEQKMAKRHLTKY